MPPLPKKETNVVAIVLVCVAIGLGVLALGSCGFIGLILAYATSHAPPHHHDDDDAAMLLASEDAGRDAGSTSSPAGDASAALASSATSAETSPPHDFEDLFAYGGGSGPRDGDVTLLSTRPGFERYSNARFGFSVEVPEALTMMPPPANDDGRQWRLGTRIAMSASGMHWVLPELPVKGLCASGKNVTAHSETESGCWATGKRAGYIHWERVVLKDEVLFSLRFQYEEALKEQMDPIVTRVSRSWKL